MRQNIIEINCIAGMGGQGKFLETKQRLSSYNHAQGKQLSAVAGSRSSAKRVEALLEIPAVYISKFIAGVKAGTRSLDSSYIVFVDDAEFIHPEIYNEFLSVMEQRGAIAVVHRTIMVVDN